MVLINGAIQEDVCQIKEAKYIEYTIELAEFDYKNEVEIYYQIATIVQIASRLSLASKGINIRGGVIDAGYTGDITIILQNKTNKPFRIEHA
ncbi:hypothetical protein G9A89_017758 [Geosiphon pyriformis]|nr:hypothetical protein G9A89_017758 [Geosiphon pyriformis]